MRIRFERTLPVTPETAWPWLVQPELMNRWSVASVERTGTARDPNIAGFERTVRMRRFGVPVSLAERVLESVPPERYVYSVRPNPVVRRHHAVITLDPRRGNTATLRWQIDMASWLPGLMPLFVRVSGQQFEQSLDRLVDLLSAERAPAGDAH